MSRFFKHFKWKIAKGKEEWFILIFSFLLALSIWTIHNLSLRYTNYLEYSVEVNTNIEGRYIDAVSLDKVMVKARTSGYYLLAYMSYENVIPLNLEPRFFHQVSPASDTFVVYISEIKGYLEESLRDLYNLSEITTESIRFVFPQISTKKVPVIAKTEFDYKSQYMPLSSLVLKPDSVVISGEDDVIGGVDAVYTDLIADSRIDKSFQGVANLIPIADVGMSQTQIYYSQSVERYVEQTIELPLNVVGVPPDKTVIPLTSNVEMSFRQLTSSHHSFSQRDFQCAIKYSDLVSSINLQVIPTLVKAPEGIYYVDFDPPYIDCIILDKK